MIVAVGEEGSGSEGMILRWEKKSSLLGLMRLECDKYQGGQFPNLERHLSVLLSFFLCDIRAVTFSPSNRVSPLPAFPLHPILLQYPLISFLLASVFFFWPSSLNFRLSFLPSLTPLSSPPIYLFPPTHSCLLTSPFLARKQAVAQPNDFHQSWLWDNGSGGRSLYFWPFMKYVTLIVCLTFSQEFPIIQINSFWCLDL